MRLGLTNTIAARGTPVGGDGLALDLQFAADKTLTARRGPTPVLTRGSTGTFVGSDGLIQSAGNNVARFDHDPVTLESRGLLIEEGRTNLSLYSGALVNAIGWGASATTSIVDGLGPDGNNAYRITETTATAIHTFGNSGGTTASGNTSVVLGTVYTGSIFIKKVSGNIDWIQVTLGGGGFGTAQYANFNIGNGTVGDSAGLASGTSPRIENYGNGWYRCSISVAATTTTTTSAGTIIGFIQNTNGTTRLPTYAGNTSNSVLAALFQFEAGSFATSYIPTTTSALARSADVCSITGADFTGMYSPLEGSVISEGSIANLIGNNRGMWGINNNTGSHGFLTLYNTPSGGVISQSRNTAATSLPPTFANSANTSFKRGLTYYSGGASISTNGATATDTVVTNSSQTMLTLQIGNMLAGAFYWSGHISAIRYYKKRLPNAKLQALTA